MKNLVIETERLLLEAPNTTDINAIFELCQDHTIQEFVIPVGRNYTRERVEYFVNEIIPKVWESGSGVELAIRIQGNDCDTLIGMTGLDFASNELGLWLGAEYREKGYGFEAISALIDWASTLKRESRPLIWSVLLDNKPSIALAEKLGFALQGTVIRENFDGQKLELLMYSK